MMGTTEPNGPQTMLNPTPIEELEVGDVVIVRFKNKPTMTTFLCVVTEEPTEQRDGLGVNCDFTSASVLRGMSAGGSEHGIKGRFNSHSHTFYRMKEYD